MVGSRDRLQAGSYSNLNPNCPVIVPAEREIKNSRVLAASREKIFAAFADPAVLAQWWGPKGFTNEFHEFDFRTGGTWRFTMRGPHGASHAMDHRFVEVAPPVRLAIRHIQPGHDFTLTITLVDHDGGTVVTWRMLFDDPAEAARVRGFLKSANEENLDRLAAQLFREP
jgi:uncharacterized protein YndB with AHSA1/START domain